jgi:nucleoside-diphosphate-sugar epimerase
VPAVQGTLNVLRVTKEVGGVRRVVLTSFVMSIVTSPGWSNGEVVDERGESGSLLIQQSPPN